MKTRSCSENGNLYPMVSCRFGTPSGTPLRNGDSPCSTKGNRQPCSHVPNISYILKKVKYRAKENRKPVFARVKGILGFENTGGQDAREIH